VNWEVRYGDCLEVMRGTAEASVDAVVCDPPYGLGFMGKKWDTPGTFVERKPERRNRFDHVGGNHNPASPQDSARTRLAEARKFQEFCETWARATLRVLKPGGHLLAFGGTRTCHRLACAIEDAGFEIRDEVDLWYDADEQFANFFDSLKPEQQDGLRRVSGSPHLSWLYGSGFPKSLDVSKAIDRAAGAEREVIGQRRGGPALTIGGDNKRPWHERQADRGGEYDITALETDDARQWRGWGTALKPAHEPIVVARKPLSESTVAANVLAHGTGALNVDACRIEGPKGDGVWSSLNATANPTFNNSPTKHEFRSEQHPGGRWPANVILDEEAAVALDLQTGTLKSGAMRKPYEYTNTGHSLGAPSGHTRQIHEANEGGASRFFYTAKASRSERGEGNTHPTVKPVSLMRWLVRLVTPPGGLVLDPFCGSGTTGVAAVREGFSFTGVERDAEYVEIARRRIDEATAVQPLLLLQS
jgi:DNA modification methylase